MLSLVRPLSVKKRIVFKQLEAFGIFMLLALTADLSSAIVLPGKRRRENPGCV